MPIFISGLRIAPLFDGHEPDGEVWAQIRNTPPKPDGSRQIGTDEDDDLLAPKEGGHTSAREDELIGGLGNDTLYGVGGDDTIHGGDDDVLLLKSAFGPNPPFAQMYRAAPQLYESCC